MPKRVYVYEECRLSVCRVHRQSEGFPRMCLTRFEAVDRVRSARKLHGVLGESAVIRANWSDFSRWKQQLICQSHSMGWLNPVEPGEHLINCVPTHYQSQLKLTIVNCTELTLQISIFNFQLLNSAADWFGLIQVDSGCFGLIRTRSLGQQPVKSKVLIQKASAFSPIIRSTGEFTADCTFK